MGELYGVYVAVRAHTVRERRIRSEGALKGALEQIAELRERVESLEAGGKVRKVIGRKSG
jgi:hypothetical protein